MPYTSRTLITFLSAICCCVVAAISHVSAQQVNAQIKGTVTDATGSAIPDAEITATRQPVAAELVFAEWA
jgi:hypothetical protein